VKPSAVRRIHARQVLDSRGRPTVEADVELAGGASGRASVPAGASTGSAEARELRDADPHRYAGRGVLRAVAGVNGEIARRLLGQDAHDQPALDRALRELDGTATLERLGANAVLAVSIAACRAAAASRGQPLHIRIGELAGVANAVLPLPMVNILSGGLHARGGMDIQDFLVIPRRADSYGEALHAISRLRDAAVDVVAARGNPTLLADEGGLSPDCRTGGEALRILVQCIERAGLRPGEDVLIAIDVAASGLRAPDGGYRFAAAGRHFSAPELVEELEGWTREFPVASIEDGLGEEDWPGWKTLSDKLGGRIQLVGDDLFTTSVARLEQGIAQGIANAVLVKPNQNGTLSGTLEVIARARAAGYATVVSARSGETEDAFIADLAVGSAAGQIKIGSLRTSNTMAKYNQLLRLEESVAHYAGAGALHGDWGR